MYYHRLCHTLADKGQLVSEASNYFSFIKDFSDDWYLSVYKYNQQQYEQFKETGSVSGITDVVTNNLWWDFDCKEDPSKAQKETVKLCKNLIKQGFNEDSLFICFSGCKGFSVEIITDKTFTPEQVTNVCSKLAEGLEYFDLSMYNASRIFRIVGTMHPATGLNKTQLSFKELETLSFDEIKELAKEPMRMHFNTIDSTFPASLEPLTVVEVKEAVEKDNIVIDIDYTKKAKGWSNCKWSLLNGNFKSGERNHAVMVMLATCRALGYPQQTAYYMAKSACKLSAKAHNEDEYNKKDIWRECEIVYSDKWQGGAYTCKNGKSPLLTKVCNNLGPHKCKHDEDGIFIEMPEFSQAFNKFATEIDKNKIKTGITSLDENVTLTTSTLVGLLGCPGSGKTSIALNILNNTSQAGLNSIFYSLDMGQPLVYLKLIQKKFGVGPDEVFKAYKTGVLHTKDNMYSIREVEHIIEQEYKRVKFSFKCGLDVPTIKDSIITYQDKIGEKVKLVVIDYLECLAGPYSDATANTAIHANQLKDLANETETCVLLLLQTQKHSSAPDEPLLSMRNIKGSSVIEQATSCVLTLYREGYSPNYADKDKFISLATVKDRLSGLWKDDYYWEGIRGSIRDLTSEEVIELEQLRELKRLKKETENKPQY
jgi:KaiC/GvpD/RAD55 family RecA-like ATPase